MDEGRDGEDEVVLHLLQTHRISKTSQSEENKIKTTQFYTMEASRMTELSVGEKGLNHSLQEGRV